MDLVTLTKDEKHLLIISSTFEIAIPSCWLTAGKEFKEFEMVMIARIRSSSTG